MTLYDEVQRLIDMVERAEISELTLQSDGRRITIRKPAKHRATSAAADPDSVESHGEGELVPAPESASMVHTVRARSVTITAPMVGVFHHAEPPVGPGAQVEAGQVVGIIESMKLMNDVRAEEDGTVHDVLAEAGLAVEFGQPLMVMDVDDSALGV